MDCMDRTKKEDVLKKVSTVLAHTMKVDGVQKTKQKNNKKTEENISMSDLEN